MNKSNIFELIPVQLRDELFEELVGANEVKIERIVSYGHKTPEDEWYDQNLPRKPLRVHRHKTPEDEWYDQRKNEWVILLSGEAVVSFLNEDDVRLVAGDYINIPAHKKHRVSWTKPNEESIWLAVHY